MPGGTEVRGTPDKNHSHSILDASYLRQVRIYRLRNPESLPFSSPEGRPVPEKSLARLPQAFASIIATSVALNLS